MILYLLSRDKHAKFSQHLLRVCYNNPVLNVLCLYVIIPQCCDNLSLLFDTLFNSELSRAWHTSLSKFSMELKTAGTVLQPHLMHVVTSRKMCSIPLLGGGRTKTHGFQLLSIR